MLARLERTNRERGVGTVRRGQDHEIDVAIREHRVDAIVCVAGSLGNDAIASAWIARCDAIQSETGRGLDQVAVEDPARISITDHDRAELSHGRPDRRPTAGPGWSWCPWMVGCCSAAPTLC